MESENDNPQLAFVREAVLLGRKWRALLDEKLRPHGLTLARSTVLYWIDQAPGTVTQRELADTVGIEGPTLVRLLHALEAQGLVERVPMVSDRRAKGLRLTAAAQPVLDTLQSVLDTVSAERLGGLDRRRLSSATQLVRDARAALE